MNHIQSNQNSTFKAFLKLATQRRERLKSGFTLLDGPHLFASWLDAGHDIGQVVLTRHGAENPEILSLLARTSAPQALLDDALFGQLSDLPSHTGVLIKVAIPPAQPMLRRGFCLLLDGVQDPGNVGAILRTAAAAGVEQVLLSDACADVWSPKVLRAGMGAQACLNMVERADLLAFASEFEGRIAATLLDGAIDLYDSDLRGDLALVMGSEGAGVSPELAKLAKLRLKIPMTPGLESLNVGAAAAICLFERVRQTR